MKYNELKYIYSNELVFDKKSIKEPHDGVKSERQGEKKRHIFHTLCPYHLPLQTCHTLHVGLFNFQITIKKRQKMFEDGDDGSP